MSKVERLSRFMRASVFARIERNCALIVSALPLTAANRRKRRSVSRHVDFATLKRVMADAAAAARLRALRRSPERLN
jgi:hypothetical protein